jgi:ribonuclease Z
MRPSFHPKLVNAPFSDPGLYIPFLFERRALLFDLGDLSALTPRDLLKVSHVFVTHTHMDHFIGFDALIRLFLGRDKELFIYGPSGFFDRVEGRLAGYTWNLVHEYETDFRLNVTEVHPTMSSTRSYLCRNRFKPGPERTVSSPQNTLLKEASFRVEVEIFDHRVPCLGFSLVEYFYVNIIKEGLKELGLQVGPWLNRFKEAVYENRGPDEAFKVTWEAGGHVVKEKRMPLGLLKEKIAKISPGQKFTYITDVIGSPENRKKIIRLAKDADQLFIEAAFLDCDKEIARKKYHLTAKEAGAMGREAGAKQIIPFHFSPRYSPNDEEILKEAMEAFEGAARTAGRS